MNTDHPFKDAEVIYKYSRTQAIEDGMLVDVSQQAKEVGFKWPVCVTDRLYTEFINVNDGIGQSMAGRLHDTLWMALNAIRSSPNEDYRLPFVCDYIIDGRRTHVSLVAAIDTTDGYPAITIMLPGDD